MAEAMNPKQIQLNLEVFEKKEGKLGKITEFCIRAEDISLQEILANTLSNSWKDFDIKTIKCHSSDLKDKSIPTNLKPTEVPYIQESIRNKKTPTIIVFKEDSNNPPVSPSQPENPQVQRTLSNVLRGMIRGMPDPEKLPAEGDDVFPPLEEESEILDVEKMSSGSSSIEGSPQKVRRRPKKTISVVEDLHTHAKDKADINSYSPFLMHRSNLAHRPRSRAVQYCSMKTKTPQKVKAMTLTHQSSVGVISPTRKQRKSMLFNGGPTSPTTGAPSGLDISDPIMKQQSYSWNRKTNFSRRTRRGKNPNFSPTKQPEMPAVTFSESQVHSITVQPEESPSFEVSCREFDTIGKLREKVLNKMKRSSCILTTSTVNSELCLTYKVEGIVYELFNDCQFIYNTAMYKAWRSDQVNSQDTSVPMVINASMRETNWELPTLYRFSKLTGVLLDEDVSRLEGVDTSAFRCIAQNDKTAVKWARRTLHSYVDEIVLRRDTMSYSLSMELESGETPMLLALKIPLDNKVEIIFHYKTVFSLTRRVKVNQYASSTLKEIFSCVLACGLVENSIELYTLQFSGEQSYLDGDYELIAFKDIRRCILKSEPINLSITKRPLAEEDNIQSLNWLPIDPNSGLPPLHTDISRDRQAELKEEIFAASMWDQTGEFSAQVVKVENLPIPMTKEAKKLTVTVELTLYHANKVLVETKRTKPLPLSSFGTIDWTEVAMFDIQIMNLPKAAKIMIVVRDHNRKESVSVNASKKKFVNILYWGLVPLFDHRGILQSGLYTMNLWKGPMPNSKVEQAAGPSFDLNPCAPCINNPDSQSVKVTVQFSRYTYPVFFPSSEPETCSFLLKKEKGSSTIRKQFDNLLKCLSEGKLPMSAFPTYVYRTNWGSLSQVIEVYMLLQQVSESEQGLPVETAMKLLDCEFADEKVRRFAVEVLDTLPDEELEDFLIQLTQALKFEPYHDSALARLLLNRALKNKRIGHFFFWYLRCELYNPLYVPRFAVLLEAYLKGCGEAMLQRFESQVDMQERLEEIGRQVEEKGGNDGPKMQSLLQEFLLQKGIDNHDLTPVYNPRIRLGQLQPKKCKIMASKKKPQWLEMKNVDPTALRMTPTRLILKLGDDLRQDVIVLRMLSLFEKLWERDGLPDLHLIPYGCMATGPNTGFIEVVKNARTIADVSGVNDPKKLYEWIRSHQKNEFGEEDPEKVRDAVKVFTHSLAGYTVATYVLGIGDRHNDNIMITSSGNLFHIDFGHFLGNIKHFLGIKREWSPFVLTPDFVYVMGGENSETFTTYKNLCCRAFLCLRRHKELIFNLFSLMRSTGIPELACVEDANYISDALMERKPDHEAEQDFRQLIKKCLDLQWTVQVMWWFHVKRTGAGSS